VLCGAPRELWKQLSRVLMTQQKPKAGSRRIAYLARIRHDDLVTLKELAEAGKLTPVIDREYPLSGVPDALRYLGTRSVRGKLVIRVA
jgi:NADPH:quinone reductase-like Zn-dependent oxidoreductase